MALNLTSETSGNTINTVNLSKVQRGQRVNLSKENPTLKRLLVKLVWEGADLDVSAVMLNENNKFVRSGTQDNIFSSMSFYKNPNCQGIKHSGDLREGGTEELLIFLDELETVCDSVIIVATSHAERVEDKVTFGCVRNAKAYIIDYDTNEALYEFDLEEDHSTSTAVEMARIYKKGGDFRLTSLEDDVGTDHMGLQAIVNKYQ